jgi:hypothetical protein
MSIPEYARTNFDTLLRAAARGDLALVECADAITGEPRCVIAAIAWNGAQFVITPFGHLAPGNPMTPTSRRDRRQTLANRLHLESESGAGTG